MAPFTVTEAGAEALLCTDHEGLTVLIASTAAYVPGDEILAARMLNYATVNVAEGELTDVEAGEHPEVEWKDLEVSRGVARLAQIASVGDESIMVYLYYADGTIGTDLVEVSKPNGLRKQDYNGATYDGATYTYVSSTSRTADGNSQTIIPSYRVGEDVLVENPIGGTGLTDVVWIESDTQRWWLEDV